MAWNGADKGPWKTDPFIASALIAPSPDPIPTSWSTTRSLGPSSALATRRRGSPEGRNDIPDLLKYHSPAVRCVALQWVGEERLTEFAGKVNEALKVQPVTREVLEYALAARQKLTTDPPAEGKPPAEFSGGQLAVDVVFDASFDPPLRSLALQLADPADKRLSAAKLKSLLDPLGVEAVRALAWREDPESQAALRKSPTTGSANWNGGGRPSPASRGRRGSRPRRSDCCSTCWPRAHRNCGWKHCGRSAVTWIARPSDNW